jgi:hypothetical protein
MFLIFPRKYRKSCLEHNCCISLHQRPPTCGSRATCGLSIYLPVAYIVEVVARRSAYDFFLT